MEDSESLFDQETGEITIVPVLVESFLVEQAPPWAPSWMLEQPGTTWLLALATTGWLLLIVWMDISLAFVLTALGTGAAVAVCWTSQQAMLAVAGMGMLTFTFVLLSRVMQVVLHAPVQPLAVAHTVVKEAGRSRVSLVFIIILLIMLPIIPMWMDEASPLRHQVQTFISWSLTLTFGLAAVMTLFLSCASVSFEIRDRQIWQLMTKPLNHFNYLAGKWIGIMSVNLILLLVSGLSTFMYVQYLRHQPPKDAYDSMAVTDQVLTARSSAFPEYQKLAEEQLQAQVDEMLNATPEYATSDDVPLAVIRAKRAELQDRNMRLQRAIRPGFVSEYTFKGLKAARESNSTITLRYLFHINRDDEHQTYRAMFFFNGDQSTARVETYVPTMSHSFQIGPSLISEQGELKVSIVNLFDGEVSEIAFATLNFDADDLEILYRVGGFEPNFLRAMLIMWAKLAFLAALGVCCGVFLSFPVACLASFTVFLASIMSPFLAEALEWYYPQEVSRMDWGNVAMVLMWVFETVVRFIASVLVYLLGAFGEISPKQKLVSGQLIPWGSVASAFLKLGLIWSGLAMLIGFSVLRKRQLAIYSGQG
jgi:hypothetical protein